MTTRTLAPLPPEADVHGQYAGFGSRGLAWVIDLALVTVAALALVWVVRGTLSFLGIALAECPRYVAFTGLDAVFVNLCRTVRGGLNIIGVLIPPLYFFGFWWLTGQTIGMGVMGLAITTTAGTRPTARVAALRLAGFAVAILPLGLGLLWSLFDDRRQGWHDKLASTYVVYRRRPHRRSVAISR